MKRPPNRKFVLAVAIVVVAMGATLSRPAASLADHEGDGMLMLKKVSAHFTMTGGR